MREQSWSILFAASIGLLMLAILLMRSEPVPAWVLVVYPTVGGLLGLTASRTSPSAEQMAWIESGTIAAAAVVVLVVLVNLLLIDMLMREGHSGGMMGGAPVQKATFFAAPAVAVLFWWALQRRLTRMRLAAAGHRRDPGRGLRSGHGAAGIPAE